MALTQKSRTAIYEVLDPEAGEEAAEEMLSYFPARDTDEPATRGDLLLTTADLHTDMADFKTELRDDMAELRTDMADFKSELRSDMGHMRTETREGLAELRIGQADLRTEMHDNMATLARWVAGGNVAAIGLAVAIGRALG